MKQTTADALAARLVNGQRWLTEAYDRLLAMPREGWRTPEEARFLFELDRWDAMVHIHAVYHVPHCIHGAGKRCPDAAVALCLRCSFAPPEAASRPAEARQGAAVASSEDRGR